MTAIINGVVVTGSPEEIKKLIDMYENEKKHKEVKTEFILNEIKKLDRKFNSLSNKNPFKVKS